jgi:hypothetical protein
MIRKKDSSSIQHRRARIHARAGATSGVPLDKIAALGD